MKQQINKQHGIGLVEVMVALLLLAVAILGFSSMQMVAIQSTDESMMRTRAMTVIRGGSEMMRANPDGINNFKATLATNATTYQGISKNSCLTTSAIPSQRQDCTAAQLGIRDAMVVKEHATNNDLQIRLIDCPGTANLVLRKQCFITSWGDTLPNAGSGAADCTDANGIYKRGAKCFMMEAY